MIIGGLQKFSLLDFPERISAIIFTQGCNFRCQYCYNPMLVQPACQCETNRASKQTQVDKSIYALSKKDKEQEGHPSISEDDLFVFLAGRRGKLDGVVITGGEPCLQPDLQDFIAKIKKLGYLVKLDTNGSFPEILESLIKNKTIDYIAMDVKAPEDKYNEVIGSKVQLDKIKRSVKIIKESGLPYEFRTTVAPILDKNDIEGIGKIIKGAGKWFLQQFKPDTELINNEMRKIKPHSQKVLAEMREMGSKYVKECKIR